jgi:hypothetical protein
MILMICIADGYLISLPAGVVQKLHEILLPFAAASLADLLMCCVQALVELQKGSALLDISLKLLLIYHSS